MSTQLGSRSLREFDWQELVRPKLLEATGWRAAPVAALAVGVGVFAEVQGVHELAFLLLAVVAVAAGWLLKARLAAIVAAAAGAALFVQALPDGGAWPQAVVEVAAVAGLALFSHRAAEGLWRERRSGEQERRVQELTFLLEAAQALGGTLDKDLILAAAVRAAAQGVSRAGDGRTAHASFHAVSGETATIALVTDEPIEQERAVGFSYELTRNQAARAAIRTGRAAFVRPDHMTGSLLQLAERLGWKVLIMTPVYSGGALIGLLAASARDTAVVERQQQRMLEVLARMTGLALGNAEDFEHERLEVVRTRESARSEVANQVSEELKDALAPVRRYIKQHKEDQALRESMADVDRLLESVESLTAIDSRTGLMRREVGLVSLERDVARAHRTLLGRHCVAYLALRDVQGRATADLLEMVAQALRARLRHEDLIFLDSEHEIVCSLSDMDTDSAWPILNEIRTSLAAEVGTKPFNIGLAALRDDQTAEEVVQAARAAVAPDRVELAPRPPD